MEHPLEPSSEGTASDQLQDLDPEDAPGFAPDKTVIAVPLLRAMEPWLDRWKMDGQKPEEGREYNPPILDVIIEINPAYESGCRGAAEDLISLIKVALQIGVNNAQAVDPIIPMNSRYVPAQLEPRVIGRLVELDEQLAQNSRSKRLVYRIWPDFAVNAL